MAKSRKKDEIEITTEMVSAGREILDLEMDIWGYGASDPSRNAFLEKLFLKMASESLEFCKVPREFGASSRLHPSRVREKQRSSR